MKLKALQSIGCGAFLCAKNNLKKVDLGVDIINFKVYNKDIELGTT